MGKILKINKNKTNIKQVKTALRSNHRCVSMYHTLE